MADGDLAYPQQGTGGISIFPRNGTNIPLATQAGQGGQPTQPTAQPIAIDPGWGSLTGAYQPDKIGKPSTSSTPTTQMQTLPNFLPNSGQPQADDWTHLAAGYQPNAIPAAPMGQGEAALHSAAHGATASFSPVFAGSLELGARYEMLNALTQAKATGQLDANGEAILAQLQSELSDPMKIYREARDREQGNVAGASAQWPWTAGVSEVGGAIATPFPWGKARAAGEAVKEAANIGGHLVEPMANAVKEHVAPWVAQMMQAIKGGAGYGGLTGTGSSVSQGEDAAHTLLNTGVGALTGAFGGLIASPVVSAAGHGVKYLGDRVATIGKGLLNDLGIVSADKMAERAVQNAENIGAPAQEAIWREKGMIRRMNEAGDLAADQGALVRGNRGDLATASLARTAADTSEAARQSITDHIQRVYSGQAQRVANGIRTMMLKKGRKPITSEEIADEVAKHEEMARTQRRAAYNTLYGSYANGVSSEELMRLTGAEPVQQAMRDAYKRWQSRAVADRGIGAPVPGVTITGKKGIMRPRGANQDVPIIPNIQFWDYVKREMDQQIGSAMRGTNPRGDDVHMLMSLKNQLYDELDRLTNGLYSDVVGGAANKFKTLGVDAKDMFEAGAKFVGTKGNRDLDPQFEKIIDGATPAEKQLFKYGFITELLSRLENTPDRDNVLNQMFLGSSKASESTRRRIKMALGDDDSKKLEALLRVESAMDKMREAQGNSWTGRLMKKYLAEGTLGTGAALFGAETWRSHGEDDDASWLTKWGPTAAMLFGFVAAHRGRQFDERVAQLIAEKLLSGSEDAQRDVVNMISKSPKLMDAIRRGSQEFADYVGRAASPGAMAYTQPFNKGTPLPSEASQQPQSGGPTPQQLRERAMQELRQRMPRPSTHPGLQ